MPNMSYCRFRNTLSDLQDCYDTLLEDDNIESDEERVAAENLVELCKDIVADAGSCFPALYDKGR